MLDLSDSGLLLDKLWPALKYGALQIEQLILSGCQVGKKPSEYVQVGLRNVSLTVPVSDGEGVLLGRGQFEEGQLLEHPPKWGDAQGDPPRAGLQPTGSLPIWAVNNRTRSS